MSLVNNLNAIKDCKEDIKTALINKGVDMTDVKFSEYAEKINSLQLESGDTPTPSPTPSVDYIYSNGYVEGGDETKDIISFEPYEITLDSEGKFVIELICPEEIPSYEGGTYFDIIFTVDVPNTYTITNFEYYDEGTTNYYEHEFKENPRHSTVNRNGVTYNSFVRKVFDNKDIASEGLKYEPYKYKITIEKN
jgi:hypothetical protein